MIRNYWLRKLFRLAPLCCFCGRRPAVNSTTHLNACERCHQLFQAAARWPGAA